MHYYTFNVGDYRKDTVHLTTLEHGIYRQLLDWYYLDETPIPKETQTVIRRLRLGSDLDIQSLQNVLNDFFVLQDDGYHQGRCDVVIAKYHENADKNKVNGKLGGRPKKTQSVILGNPTETESKGNHQPITINQEPIIKEGKPSLSGTTFPPCPHKELLSLWAKHMPHLTQPRIWEGNRQVNMKQRWIQAGKPSDYSPEGYKTTQAGVKWWDSFFAYIANDTSLAVGFENNGRTWKPDLEWVVNATNFQKIIDGKYAK